MNIVVTRKVFTDKSTISQVIVDDVFECYMLEDMDRGLRKDMPLEEIKAKKVHGKTAIPYGQYEVIVSYSNRFKKYLPLLLNVPGFEGIRIHAGNKAEDTEGCLLPGLSQNTNFVGGSRIAFQDLFAKIQAKKEKEKIILTIK